MKSRRSRFGSCAVVLFVVVANLSQLILIRGLHDYSDESDRR